MFYGTVIQMFYQKKENYLLNSDLFDKAIKLAKTQMLYNALLSLKNQDDDNKIVPTNSDITLDLVMIFYKKLLNLRSPEE